MNAPLIKGRTIVSTKGQVILPKAVRDALRWPSGTSLVVEQTIDGVLLRAVPKIAATRFEDVFGSLKHDGPALSIEEMNAGILAEAARQHERGRY